MIRHRPSRWLAASLVLLLGVLSSLADAARPTVARLLPQDTIAYVRVTDAQQLIKRFQDTAMGRIAKDKEIQPLVGDLYGSAVESFAPVEEQLGLSLDKLLALPQGEICVAITSPPAGPPAFVLLFEAGDKMPEARKLLARGDELAKMNGTFPTPEKYAGVTLNVYPLNDNGDIAAYFERDGVIVIGTRLDLLKTMIDAWDGTLPAGSRQLADSRKFTAIMTRCVATREDPPQITFYVDPILFVKTANRGNAATQLLLGGLLPALGLDGLQGIGGAVTMATAEYDMVTHLHVLINEPRSGVLKAIALDSGDTTPEPFVPADIASYMTLNYDVQRSYWEVEKLYDSIRGDGALFDFLKTRIDDRLDISFDKDLIKAAAGRFTYYSWIERPVTASSQATLVAVKLKDPKAFSATVEKLVKKFEGNLERGVFGSTVYWRAKGRPPRAFEEAGPDGPPRDVRLEVRPPQPCFAILDDYFLFSDRPSCLENAVLTNTAGTKLLKDDLEFKLIANKIRRQPGGDKPGLVTFTRPEESMKMMYDLVQAENTRNVLASQAERNGFFRGVETAMKNHPLPPFSVFQKYLAPGGGYLISDNSGFHYASFGLRREQEAVPLQK